MKHRWISQDEGALDGTRITVVRNDYRNCQTTDNEIVVLKGEGFFNSYVNMTRGHSIKRILEVGIFEGGSTLLLADLFPEARIVGVDLRPENPAVMRHAGRLGFQDRISLHYKTSQDNSARLAEIVEADLGGEIDFVLDDASHHYEPTRKTFETVFPLVRPGGFYVIEDWAWSHWPGDSFAGWKSPVLANLIFEITMASAAMKGLVAEISANSAFAVVRRGDAPKRGPIDLDRIIQKKNRIWTRL